ncbi:MAG: sigma-70 family RNA polymerase sigma factor [Kangiellaceae bacterium]|jgi:RNA polymerase sigma-70 factor (ECF subfamily)|nr:sigma-70 family RNA polymerase sigma factor [Kangiellaceae bacterium]
MITTFNMTDKVMVTTGPHSSGSLVKEPNEDSSQLSEYLLAVATHRDVAAFNKLFAWFAPKIKRVAEKKLNSSSAGMDIAQETMTKVWRKAHLYSPDKGAASTWVYTVMRNVIFDALRKIKNHQTESISDDIWPTEDIAIDENVFQDHLEDRKLKELVNQLPKAQQETLKAIYFQQLTHEQLAQQLNVPLGTVKSRIRLAVNKLKQQMGAIDD